MVLVGEGVAAIVPHHLACCLVTAASCAALWASIAAMCASMARWCATSAALMEERELLPDQRGVGVLCEHRQLALESFTS